MVFLPQFLLSGLLLRFDGSLRTPKDTGFPVRDLQHISACACAVVTRDDTSQRIALGGRAVSLRPDMTSADAEYEGLLTGLRFLAKQNGGSEWVLEGDTHLKIMGDCKSLIDQFNRLSRPRKMLDKHEKAMRLINSLDFIKSVEYKHVARANNQVCDAMSADIVRMVTQVGLADFRKSLDASSFDTSIRFKKKKKKSKEIKTELSTLIEDSMEGHSLLPHGKRPRLLRLAANHARTIGDGCALNAIGTVLEQEAKLWPEGGISRTDVVYDEKRELLTTEAFLLQVEGFRLMGFDEDAEKLEKKKRHQLLNYGVDGLALPCEVEDPMKITFQGGQGFERWRKRMEEEMLQSNGKSKEEVWTLLEVAKRSSKSTKRVAP